MGVRFGILSVLNVGIVGGQRARRNMLVVLNVTQSLSDVDVVFCAGALVIDSNETNETRV